MREVGGPGMMPLGLCRTPQTPSRGVATLEDGQALVLYSDGVPDRRDRSDAPIGLERSIDVIAGVRPRSAPALVKAIQDTVLRANDEPIRDDATVVVLQPRPVRGEPAS